MKKIAFILLLTITFGCTNNSSPPIPEKFQNLENLNVYSPDEEPNFTFTFEKDMIYGESDDLMIGNMGEVVVDKLGRVYIADVQMMVLNVFDPEGNFIKRLGGEGQGPGEFSSYVRDIQIRGDYLYAFDPDPRRIHIFDINTLAGLNTVILGDNRTDFPDLAKAYPWIAGIYARSDSTFIVKYINHTRDVKHWDNVEVTGLLYRMDQNGVISGEFLTYMSEIRTANTLIFNYEMFFSKVHVIISDDNRFYMAEPDYFLVKQFSELGNYEQSFFYPLVTHLLTEDSAIKLGFHERIIEDMHNMDLPEFWPVVSDMLIDDQDQLWVATTVEDFSVYEWWVVKTTGELVARFNWPRNKPLEYIANGNIFTKETDEESGLQQIVQYNIVVD